MHQLQKRYCPGPCACSGWCMYTEDEWSLILSKEIYDREEYPECHCPCHNRPDFYESRACTVCGHKAPYVYPIVK